MTAELRSIRALPKESLRGVEPSIVSKKLPRFEWVDPKTLYVEDAYQRSVGENGVALVRRIYAKFSWGRFKPPICVRLPDSGNVLVVIDGQHTATAAACHPNVPKIPVMVVDADDVASRADNFVGHNRDRLALTNLAIYRADLVRGDSVAIAIDRACKAAGARILERHTSTRQALEPGATVSVGAIRAVFRRHGEELLGKVLAVLTKAGRAPILAEEIGAAEIVLAKMPGAAERLRAVVASKPAARWKSVAISRIADTGEKPPAALAACWLAELSGIPADVPRPASTVPPRSQSQVKPTTPNAVPRQAEEPVRQPAAPVRQPEAAPSKPPTPIALDGKPAGERFVERNGVRFDLLPRSIQHRGREDVVDAEGLRFVAALARVMPSFLPPENVAKAAFGSVADAGFKLRGTADRTNRVLSGLRLEIREIAKMGWMLADLGGE